MATGYTDTQIDEWIAEYVARRARAQTKVDGIEKEGWRFEEGAGPGKMQDVTEELLKDWKDEVSVWDRLIAEYESWKSSSRTT
jgi:hypothetical protein